MAEGVGDRVLPAAPGGQALVDEDQHVDGVADPDAQDEDRQHRENDREGDVQPDHQAEIGDHRGRHDRHGKEDAGYTPKQQKQEEHEYQGGGADVHAGVTGHAAGDLAGDDRASHDEEPEVGAVVAFDHGPEHRHQLALLVLGEEDAAVRGDARVPRRLVEARERLLHAPVAAGVDDGLDRHRGQAAVAGDHVVDVEGVGEDAAAQIFQRLRRLGPIFHQVFDDERVVLTARLPDVDEARHLADVGQDGLELVVEGPQPLQEGEVEDLGGLDGNQDPIVLTEPALELLVFERSRVGAVEVALRGVLRPQVGEKGGHGGQEQQAQAEHQVAAGVDRVPPSLEGPIDAIAKSHVTSPTLRVARSARLPLALPRVVDKRRHSAHLRDHVP